METRGRHSAIATPATAPASIVRELSDERLEEHLGRLALIEDAIVDEDRYLDGFVGDEEDLPHGGRRRPCGFSPGSPRRARALVLARMAEEGMPLGRWVEHGRRALYLRKTLRDGSPPAASGNRSADLAAEQSYELLEASRRVARKAPAGEDPRVTVEVARLRGVLRVQLAGAAGLLSLYCGLAALGVALPSWAFPALLGGLCPSSPGERSRRSAA